MKFHLILRYVHECIHRLKFKLIKLYLGLVLKVHCQAISPGKVSFVNWEDHS